MNAAQEKGVRLQQGGRGMQQELCNNAGTRSQGKGRGFRKGKSET